LNQAIIVVGLGFGDEGKGATVDFLCRTRKVSCVIRFNGGAQAGHNMVDPILGWHSYSQFGSGTHLGVPTYLSEHTILDPLSLVFETQHLNKMGISPLSNLYIHENALIITPYQKAANRVREFRRGDAAHGTTGMGIGETVEDNIHHGELVLRASDLASLSEHKLQDRLEGIRRMKLELLGTCHKEAHKELRLYPHDVCIGYLYRPEKIPIIAELLHKISKRLNVVDAQYLRDISTKGDLVFEGAQGALLDQDLGFAPHTTWSKTTKANANWLLNAIGYPGQRRVLGVMRSFLTRHGQGPFPTEIYSHPYRDRDNHDWGWQGRFRVGYMDLVLTRYAILANMGIDSIALNHLDCTEHFTRICIGYRVLGSSLNSIHQPLVAKDTKILELVQPMYMEHPPPKKRLVESLERRLGIPISIIANGPTHYDRRWNSIHSQGDWPNQGSQEQDPDEC